MCYVENETNVYADGTRCNQPYWWLCRNSIARHPCWNTRERYGGEVFAKTASPWRNTPTQPLASKAAASKLEPTPKMKDKIKESKAYDTSSRSTAKTSKSQDKHFKFVYKPAKVRFALYPSWPKIKKETQPIKKESKKKQSTLETKTYTPAPDPPPAVHKFKQTWPQTSKNYYASDAFQKYSSGSETVVEVTTGASIRNKPVWTADNWDHKCGQNFLPQQRNTMYGDEQPARDYYNRRPSSFPCYRPSGPPLHRSPQRPHSQPQNYGQHHYDNFEQPKMADKHGPRYRSCSPNVKSKEHSRVQTHAHFHTKSPPTSPRSKARQPIDISVIRAVAQSRAERDHARQRAAASARIAHLESDIEELRSKKREVEKTLGMLRAGDRATGKDRGRETEREKERVTWERGLAGEWRANDRRDTGRWDESSRERTSRSGGVRLEAEKSRAWNKYVNRRRSDEVDRLSRERERGKPMEREQQREQECQRQRREKERPRTHDRDRIRKREAEMERQLERERPRNRFDLKARGNWRDGKRERQREREHEREPWAEREGPGEPFDRGDEREREREREREQRGRDLRSSQRRSPAWVRTRLRVS